jgi:hypothetical protein
MQSARLVVHLGIALALTAGLAACDSPRVRSSPLRPGAVLAFTGLELVGPGTVPPGGTAAFTATVRLADGRRKDVTADGLWHSSAPSVLSIDAAGLAAAHQPGDTHLSVNFGNQRSSREVIVVPTGTYRLSGIVLESGTADAAVADALVQVIVGSGAGLSTTTGPDGRYRLYGVTGDTEVQVTKEGYQSRAVRVVAAGHVTQDIELSLEQPREDFSGVYALTVTAANSCRDMLPEPIRSRTYTAQLTQNGPYVDVRLSGAIFAITPAGRGDRFRGRVDPDGLSFSLNPHIYRYYGYAQYPDIVEQLADGSGYLALDGSVVARGTRARLAGILEGSYQFFKWDPAWGGTVTAECRGGHEFGLSRIGA